MSCYNPHFALNLGLNNETGKNVIKFLPRRHDVNLQQLRYKYGEDNVLSLPCGHCLGCNLDYAKEWAVRCQLESLYYPDSSFFITLTYRDECCPDRLLKSDLQKFVKNIRNDGFKVRYFACGEYGDEKKSHRPHFHLMLFGLQLMDLRLFAKTSTGYLYTSKTIEKYWPYGFSTICPSSFNCAGYIARYCLKKRMSGKDKDEFILMSKKPGLGERYFLDHKEELIQYDKVVGSFGSSLKASMPRYFDKLAEKLGIDISINKDKRMNLSKQLTQSDLINFGFDHEEMLYRYKSEVKSHVLKVLPRNL